MYGKKYRKMITKYRLSLWISDGALLHYEGSMRPSVFAPLASIVPPPKHIMLQFGAIVTRPHILQDVAKVVHLILDFRKIMSERFKVCSGEVKFGSSLKVCEAQDRLCRHQLSVRSQLRWQSGGPPFGPLPLVNGNSLIGVEHHQLIAPRLERYERGAVWRRPFQIIHASVSGPSPGFHQNRRVLYARRTNLQRRHLDNNTNTNTNDSNSNNNNSNNTTNAKKTALLTAV
eukprot:GHVS01084533.1.p1 GENE.GHVS01084533.1~~GHVS01084533.1.p1  ORF type:complete len:230 (+),score=29.97 GHVS01084533.1:76-765(+)